MKQVLARNGADGVEVSVAPRVIFILQRVDNVGAVLRNDQEFRVRLARVFGKCDDEIDHAGRRLAFGLRVARHAVLTVDDATPVIIPVDNIEIGAIESARHNFVEPPGAVSIENDRLPAGIPVPHLARIRPGLVPTPEPFGRIVRRLTRRALVLVCVGRPSVLPVIAIVGGFADRDIRHDDGMGCLSRFEAFYLRRRERASIRPVLGKIHDDQIVRRHFELSNAEL